MVDRGVIQQEGVTDFDIIGLSHYCKSWRIEYYEKGLLIPFVRW